MIRNPQQEFDVITSSVELKSGLKGNALFGGRCFCIRRLGGVQRVNVGLVVLGVVKHHDLVRDIRFKGIVGVGKRRKSIGHFFCTFATMGVEDEEGILLGFMDE
jgi:hypothetical protein